MVNEVLCRLYEHVVKRVGRGALVGDEVFGRENGAPVVCHLCQNGGAIGEWIEA